MRALKIFLPMSLLLAVALAVLWIATGEDNGKTSSDAAYEKTTIHGVEQTEESLESTLAKTKLLLEQVNKDLSLTTDPEKRDSLLRKKEIFVLTIERLEKGIFPPFESHGKI